MATARKSGALAAATSRAPAVSGLAVVLTTAALVVGLAALLPLVQVGGATTTAGRIERLEQEKRDWQARLRQQEVEVAELGSLERIEREAAYRLKMRPPVEVHFITVPVPPPEPRRLPARFLPPEPAADAGAAGGTSLLDEILSWLP